MTPDRWRKVEELFHAALDLAPAARGGFLDEACAGDLALRGEVESLLVSYEESGGFSRAPAFEDGLSLLEESGGEKDASLAGRKIGPYKILREIGRGGMGAVYLAARADDAYHKEVAIKLVKRGLDTDLVLRRFQNERQILANLDHPNITRLLDGGTTEQGLPYFVMEYIDGKPIDRYCEERGLGVTERLELFRKVCGAVHYAHQNLVIHRDIKPGNVLVTAEGVPRLLDFGIAKLLNPETSTETQPTATALRVMTPGYASPEQLRGETVTTASDVYSLGVLLYELLTGRRPHRWTGPTQAEIERIGMEEPEKPSAVVGRGEDARREGVRRSGDGSPERGPEAAAAKAGGAGRTGEPRASALRREETPGSADPRAAGRVVSEGASIETLRRRLRGDLDNIVLMAMRKEPQRRYASAQQLSEEIRRHLAGLPVIARADTAAYRSAKFIKRHKPGVAAAALVFLTLVGGIVGTLWQARLARTERARAERQFNDVRKLATSFLFEFDRSIQNLSGSTPARQLLVQRALEYLSKLSEESHDDRRLQRDLVEAYLKVGDVQGNPYAPNLGDTKGAAKTYAKAQEISRGLVQADPIDRDAQRYLARSYKALGQVLSQLGNPGEAEADFRRAAGILETLTADGRGDPGLRDELANCYQVLGDVQGHAGLPNLGDPAGALESYRKALTLYEDLVAHGDADKSARRGVALLQIRIGDLEADRDDLGGGLQAYRGALAISEELAAEDATNAEDRRRLALAYRKVGGMQESLGDFQGALRGYLRASSINESLMDADPANAQASMNYAISLRWTGDLLNKMGDSAGALAKYRRVLEILDKLAANEPENILVGGRRSDMLIVTAGLLARSGRTTEARSLTSRGLALARDLAGRSDATPDDLSQYALDLLSCEPTDLRDPRAALELAERSVTRSGGTDSDDLDVLAQACFQNGDVARAIETEERALALLSPAQPNQREQPNRRRIESHLAGFRAALKHG